MRGALLINFDELVKDFGLDYIEISVNGSIRRIRYQDTNTLYTTPINLNDVVSLSIYTSPTDLDKQISITRKDYTIDAEDGDNGIRDTFITSSSGNSNPLTVTFTGTTTSDAYGFRYIVDASSFCFDIGTGFNSTVQDTKIQSDGKILLGGTFTTYKGVTSNRIIRLNTDASIDTSFNVGTGFDGTVIDIQIQSDGKILVGGGFTTYSGVTSNRIIRLNTDGSIDTSFTYGTGFFSTPTSSIQDMEIQSDGKIVLVGRFTSYNGTATPTNICRLNSDGTLDTSFNSGGSGLFGGLGLCVNIQSDGKIIVGGDFLNYNAGFPAPEANAKLIRLNSDGTQDTSFVKASANIALPYNVDLQSDGKLLVVGGAISLSGGGLEMGIVRLNTDGSSDTSFNNNIPTTFTGDTYDVKVLLSGKILMSGGFSQFAGVSQGGLIRLNSNGTVDTTFNSGGSGFNTGGNFGQAEVIAIDSFNNIIMGGDFTTYNSITANRIIKLSSTGTSLNC
jgi:uncharacterized delta-60 repeat protein